MSYTIYQGRTPQPGERLCNPKGSAEYAAWHDMYTRCRNPKYKEWSSYGGRGIKVCLRWCDYACFLADMGRMPAPRYTLDRINVDGNYTPANCHWLPRYLNIKHGRTEYTAFNQRKRLREWLDDSRCRIRSTNIFYMRLRLGWTAQRALSTPSTRK